MFTGLIEETGKVVALEKSDASGSARLFISASCITADVRLGDSIAVNGCCLTVVQQSENKITFDLLAETLQRTNLSRLQSGSLMNLEHALAVGARMGGHFVQGHIDCTAPVRAFKPAGTDHRLEIALPAEFARYVVFKDSIAVNGISLTVAEVCDESFVVWVIPHTFSATNLREVKAGDLVNLEFDLLAKYVERILQK